LFKYLLDIYDEITILFAIYCAFLA